MDITVLVCRGKILVVKKIKHNSVLYFHILNVYCIITPGLKSLRPICAHKAGREGATDYPTINMYARGLFVYAPLLLPILLFDYEPTPPN